VYIVVVVVVIIEFFTLPLASKISWVKTLFFTSCTKLLLNAFRTNSGTDGYLGEAVDTRTCRLRRSIINSGTVRNRRRRSHSRGRPCSKIRGFIPDKLLLVAFVVHDRPESKVSNGRAVFNATYDLRRIAHYFTNRLTTHKHRLG